MEMIKDYYPSKRRYLSDNTAQYPRRRESAATPP
jgi:hypothetical protein